ncbi:autoinducer binding domain-containing protein [Rhodobacter sp. KR11]|uniref:autoinducer binding domain-containing protein n=1 Tax=Rhodobacter sp. KR11 TaxID=2974588 RepID=UPI002222AE6E|nr:autoinducer binding domain-containing protein [Rhodobacter sp. KR11]MCW1919699.1 autoinducer binding domain-containing protein [Rhodobacter sp. KR11]
MGRLQALCDTGYALAIHIRLTRPTLLYQTYDAAWSDHYSENGYMLSDPVVHWGLENAGTVFWADLADKDPEGVLKSAAAHGLHHGWTIARGDRFDKTIAGMTRSDRAHTAEEQVEIQEIVAEIHAMTADFVTWPPALQEQARRLLL